MPNHSKTTTSALDQKGGEIRAVAYLRVSTDDQVDSGLGLAAQRAAIERFAAAKGYTVSAWFEDNGVSGAAPLEKRGGLLAALSALEPGSVLLVAKRDRLSRDMMLSGWLDKEAMRREARILSAAGEGTEDDGPNSILMRRIIDAFAEFERGVIKARTKAALASKRAKGEKLGGRVPYGYKLEGAKLVEDAHEQSGLRIIRSMRARATPATMREIGKALTEAGYKPKNSPNWHPKVIRDLARR